MTAYYIAWEFNLSKYKYLNAASHEKQSSLFVFKLQTKCLPREIIRHGRQETHKPASSHFIVSLAVCAPNNGHAKFPLSETAAAMTGPERNCFSISMENVHRYTIYFSSHLSMASDDRNVSGNFTLSCHRLIAEKSPGRERRRRIEREKGEEKVFCSKPE